MVMLDHVEKLVPSKVTITAPASPAKEERAVNQKDEQPKRGRKPKED